MKTTVAFTIIIFLSIGLTIFSCTRKDELNCGGDCPYNLICKQGTCACPPKSRVTSFFPFGCMTDIASIQGSTIINGAYIALNDSNCVFGKQEYQFGPISSNDTLYTNPAPGWQSGFAEESLIAQDLSDVSKAYQIIPYLVRVLPSKQYRIDMKGNFKGNCSTPFTSNTFVATGILSTNFDTMKITYYYKCGNTSKVDTCNETRYLFKAE